MEESSHPDHAKNGVETMAMTAEQFNQLTAFERGYAVYMAGCRDDEPNIPDEGNPYPVGHAEHTQWCDGQNAAMLAVIDMVE